MGADYSFYMKSIAAYALAFLRYNNSVLARVKNKLFYGLNFAQFFIVLSELKADRHLNHWQLTRIDSMKYIQRSFMTAM